MLRFPWKSEPTALARNLPSEPKFCLGCQEHHQLGARRTQHQPPPSWCGESLSSLLAAAFFYKVTVDADTETDEQGDAGARSLSASAHVFTKGPPHSCLMSASARGPLV